MICQHCNYEVPEGVYFCPRCGHAINNAYGGNQNFNNAYGGNQNFNNAYGGNQNFNNAYGGNQNFNNAYGESQNFNNAYGGNQNQNSNSFFNPRNIERYAPAATLLPLVMAILGGIIHGLLSLILGLVLQSDSIIDIIMILLNIIFCVLALGALSGLIYVVVKTKNAAYVAVWAVPAAVFMAFISCICIAFGWAIPAFLFGLIAFVMGLEMIPRITISGHPMESRIDPGMAVATYKMLFPKRTTAYSTAGNSVPQGMASGMGTPAGAWEKPVSPATPSEESYFDGAGIELFGNWLLAVLVSSITCGIAAPWMTCRIYKWQYRHSVINGKRLTFTGTGASLLGHMLLWGLLSIVTFGLYPVLGFLHIARIKWESSHVFIEGEPISSATNASYFDGNIFEDYGYYTLGLLFTAVTCGIWLPWWVCVSRKWKTTRTVINGRRLKFNGRGADFLGEFILIALLTLITCGIYIPWGAVRMFRYITKHTSFEM